VTVNSSPIQGSYNPFTSNFFASANLALTIDRSRFTSGGAKTQTVNFVLLPSSTVPSSLIGGANGITMTYNGASILYPSQTAADGANVPTVGSQAAGQVYHNYGGNTDTATFNVNVLIPAGLDLVANPNIPFDLYYTCMGTGGMSSVETPERFPNAASINITVASALQAYFAGSALDFGDITNLTLTQAQAKTTGAGNLRIRSTGPYSISVDSAKDFVMTPGNAATTDANQRVPYELSIMGSTLRGTATMTQTCARASMVEKSISVSAKLIQATAGKSAASNYRDEITVTFTPLAATTPATTTCAL
jgi:hypothetical protein